MSDERKRKSGSSRKRGSAEKTGSTKKSGGKLPAFGFAADLLKEAGDPADAEAAAEAAGPERIFSFAERLEAENAAEEEPESRPQRLETWVTFELAGETFALPVAPIREVLRVHTITRVPHAPHPIRGVSNLRGRVIPVIDLRQRIDLPPAELDRSSRILVVSSRGRLIGLLVDAVHQVVHIDLHRVQPPPQDVMTIEAHYITGVYQTEQQLILLLDVDRVLIIHEAGAA